MLYAVDYVIDDSEYQIEDIEEVAARHYIHDIIERIYEDSNFDKKDLGKRNGYRKKRISLYAFKDVESILKFVEDIKKAEKYFEKEKEKDEKSEIS